jgi:hypothetical protein
MLVVALKLNAGLISYHGLTPVPETPIDGLVE